MSPPLSTLRDQPTEGVNLESQTKSASGSSRVRIFMGPNPSVLKKKQKPTQPSQGDHPWGSWDSNDRSPNRASWVETGFSPPRSPSNPSPSVFATPSTSQDDTDGSQDTSDLHSSHPAELDDDGSRRCFLRRPLNGVPGALDACGLELDGSAASASAVSRKRKRNKGKNDVRCGRGLARGREPAPPEDRPEIFIVGDAEFTSSPLCKKIISTIRLLTLENLPGPYRSWKSFPSKTRLLILQQFLQRYSWGAGEDTVQCIDVFERIAADAYMHQLTEERARCIKKYGETKEVWKDNPPIWCKNAEHWKGLVNIWCKDKFVKQSATNRENRVGPEEKKRHVVYHVSGSRSSYRHKTSLVMKITLLHNYTDLA